MAHVIGCMTWLLLSGLVAASLVVLSSESMLSASWNTAVFSVAGYFRRGATAFADKER
jgi:hypothetical protein